MVMLKKCVTAILLIAAVVTPLCSRADSVLEQMQDEVAAISSKARSAVVTIEDGRLLLGSTAAIDNGVREISSVTTSTSGTTTAQDLQSVVSSSSPASAASSLAQDTTKPATGNGRTQDSFSLQQLPVIGRLFNKNTDNVVSRLQDAFMTTSPKSGTGFSIGEGYIVTTADVLEGMQNPFVITDDGTRIKSTIIGIDSELNIGLLKLAAKVDLPALTLGRSSLVKVGHFAITISNQAGQPNSVALMLIGNVKTEGTTAGNRFYPSLIQIAGTIGAGASGAPLLNARGEVIGIIAGTPGGDTSHIYMNPRRTYSLPSLQRKYILPRALSPAKPQTPKSSSNTGASGTTETSKMASALAQAIVNDKKQPQVIYVLPQSPITLTQQALPPLVYKVFQNDTNGQQFTTEVPALQGTTTFGNGGTAQTQYLNSYVNTLASSALSPVITSAGLAIPIDDIRPIIDDMRAGKRAVHVWIGVTLNDIAKNVEQEGIVHVDRSVQIYQVYAASPAQQYGLQVGDTLLSLDGIPVHTHNEVSTRIMRMRPGDTLTVVIQRGGTNRSIDLKLEPKPTNPTVATPASPGR